MRVPCSKGKDMIVLSVEPFCIYKEKSYYYTRMPCCRGKVMIVLSMKTCRVAEEKSRYYTLDKACLLQKKYHDCAECESHAVLRRKFMILLSKKDAFLQRKGHDSTVDKICRVAETLLLNDYEEEAL
ncbi:hypothetical protein CHS0354_042437 [Potamilus streckersoni]|uniref:Uncharacterized protein n=1 Tax=Potamilus streckersoni TaxID=2493646 RepID=A0AAE0VRT1_9BIVA|nr:hypothetical protein CHS0354_042437 [Potamilus streckersoni]